MEVPPNDSPGTPSLPEPPKKKRVKPKGQSPVGRPSLTPEQKKNNKEARKANRAALIQQLYAEGKISGPEARRQAKKAGVLLEGDVDVEATKDDPSLMGKLQEKFALQQSVIDLRGGKGISVLDENERIRFLEFLEVGMGRHSACRQMKIDYRRFLNTFTCDADFKSQVITVEESLIGLCTMRIYESASEGDLSSAALFIRIKEQQSSAVFNRKLQMKEAKLKEKALDAQLDLMKPTDRPSFDCFTKEELNDYASITDKLKSGEIATPDELSRLGILSAKLIAHNATKAIEQS